MPWINNEWLGDAVWVPSGVQRAAYAVWIDAIGALIGRFESGELPVPMTTGGHGTLNVAARRLLCEGYRAAASAKLRARAVRRLLGRVPAAAAMQRRTPGRNREPREFRLGAAILFERHPPLLVQGQPFTVPIADRWTVVLAAIYALDKTPGAWGEYRDAVSRCKQGGATTSVNLGPGGHKIGSRPQVAWNYAANCLANPNLGPRLRVRYLLHVLMAMLFVLPTPRMYQNRLIGQLRDWLRLRAELPENQELEKACSGEGGPHIAALRALWPALEALKLFGGEEPLALAPHDRVLPSCFRPYAGGPVPRLDLIRPRLRNPAHQSQIGQAHALAALVFDKLTDSLQIQGEPAIFGQGFNRVGYWHLKSLMTSARDVMGWGGLSPPFSDTRLQVTRHVVDMATPPPRGGQSYVDRLAAVLPRAERHLTNEKRHLTNEVCMACWNHLFGFGP